MKICRTAGWPTAQCVNLWRRADPAMQTAVTEALLAGQRRRTRVLEFADRTAVVREIADGLAEGIALWKICRAPGMPAPRTVWQWCVEDPRTATVLALARQWGEIALGEEILEIADLPEVAITTETENSKTVESTNRKLQIDTRFKLLGIWQRNTRHLAR